MSYELILGRLQGYASLNPSASYEEMYKWYRATFNSMPPPPDPFPAFPNIGALAGWMYEIQT